MNQDNTTSAVVASEVHQKIIDILRAHGAEYIALFGSTARGEARPDSDLDVLVRFNENENISLLDHIGIMHEIEDAIQKKVDLVTERSLKKTIAPFVKNDLRVLYGQGERSDLR